MRRVVKRDYVNEGYQNEAEAIRIKCQQFAAEMGWKTCIIQGLTSVDGKVTQQGVMMGAIRDVEDLVVKLGCMLMETEMRAKENLREN